MSSDSLALGIDIGGSNTKMGLVSPEGVLTDVRRMPTEARGSDPGPFLSRFLPLVDEVFAAGEGRLIGIGVSMHGAIDEERRGPIACNNTPALRGLNMRGLLEERYGLPVVVNNDLTAHSLGEYRFGTGRGSRRFMALAIGTGLGASIILDGEPLRFGYGTAGDTGRLILDPDGPVDVYGVRGSAEILCGVPGIERLARMHYGRDVPARDVITAARERSDERAVAIIQQIGAYLGFTLANLSMIFYPDKVALTGGTAEAGEVLLEAVRKRFYELLGDYYRIVSELTGGAIRPVEIVLGRGGETGILGAVVELLPPAGQPPDPQSP
ncbi:MAG: ROK family protein [Anaerolineae bacterium]|nr:ROK family protein [Anaerolineae bacterium]